MQDVVPLDLLIDSMYGDILLWTMSDSMRGVICLSVR